ncbi:hypothetical protein AGABI1DRAFT_122637 [Agaricus bisporus var. burnettii JB137-S8]|uniref:Aprataxin C2HE/C2H2/C2HC zinc finger domain-containing protein n=1 Tax=Agaricus bisporus var. burnettii (strain JB137-S8 / ATCC MYA-4627 / FGSC 10392) TaxID=597362 RepID=K5WMD0_AGABU|nr:uncharacterized protein AGABI1DRAFT_122637 [Agaricus bisporus var. burnettii JB137-S8]EKM76481.1 hypothetical protein AGABI1DRAFT_122637 [Agaricus bisporus var. burnettii JB137-S8]
MHPNLTLLRTYALKDPLTLPASILFCHSDRNMTIYDAYPKSMFHFLVLPRASSTSNKLASPETGGGVVSQKRLPLASDLSSLRTLLNSKNVDKQGAKDILTSMKDEGMKMKNEIEREMEKRYGFVWDVWMGFHGAPSMEHLHMHVISSDLVSEKLKHKKHYNSFHPKLGFFLHIDEVLTWFDAESTYYQNMIKHPFSKYEPLLKVPLSCFHCHSEQKNIPTLKKHLQDEWFRLQSQNERKKRKLEVHECSLLNDKVEIKFIVP